MANKATIAAQIASLLADNTAGDISAADARTIASALLDNTLNPADDIISQVDAETGTATTAQLWSAERVAQAIAALAPSALPLATAGSSITLNRAAGRVYGTTAAPLTGALTLDLTGAVDYGYAVVYYEAATDPLSAIINNSTVKSFGYLFTANKLIKIVIRREPGGLVTVFSEQADANQAPQVTAWSVSGLEEVGQTLQFGYTYVDSEGDLEDTGAGGTQYRIIRYASVADYDADTNRTVVVAAADALGSPVSYQLQAGDENGYIAAEVQPRAASGETGSTWYRSPRTNQIQAAGSQFDVTALNWNVLLDTPITGSPSASIIGGDVQAWGDRSGNGNTAEATNTAWRPDLITDADNSEEAADHSATGRRLTIANDPSMVITGNNWTAYLVMKLNAVAAVTNIIGSNASTSGDGFLIQCDPGITDPAVAADMKVFGDTSISVQDVYPDSLPIGNRFVLKVRCVAGTLDVFVHAAGGSLTQVGSTLTGRSIATTHQGNPIYLDVARIVNGQFQFVGLKNGTLTAQEQTDLESYLATKFL